MTVQAYVSHSVTLCQPCRATRVPRRATPAAALHPLGPTVRPSDCRRHCPPRPRTTLPPRWASAAAARLDPCMIWTIGMEELMRMAAEDVMYESDRLYEFDRPHCMGGLTNAIFFPSLLFSLWVHLCELSWKQETDFLDAVFGDCHCLRFLRANVILLFHSQFKWHLYNAFY